MIACPFNIPATVTRAPSIRCQEVHLLPRYPPEERQPPACVEICPQQALTFGKRKDMIKIAHQRIQNEPGRYVDHLYGEKEAGRNRLDVSFQRALRTGRFRRDDRQNEPILNNVKDFLGTVPMVLAIWPALFTGFHLLAKRKDGHGHDDASWRGQSATHGEEGDES